MQVSWGYHYERNRVDERDEFGSTPRIRSLEFEGTRDPCAWLAVPAAIDFQTELGWERIRERCDGLVAQVRRRLDGMGGMSLATPNNPAMRGRLTAFRLPAGINLKLLKDNLWERRIEVNAFERPEGAILRVSTHFYNTDEEIELLELVLPELLEKAKPV
jgi:isopenicillin-N epimerase